jgi:hypothetical protein
MSYFIMHRDFAEPLLKKFPKAAKYDKKQLRLVGEMPDDFEGEIVRLYDMGLTMTQLSELVDGLRNEPTHTGKLVIISTAQGKWLYANHEAFMPIITEDI